VVEVHQKANRIRDVYRQSHIQGTAKVKGLHQGFPTQRRVSKDMEQIGVHFDFHFGYLY
jgi:hypothetical protein